MGGGNRRVKTWRSNALGLSPRGRGKLGDERAGLHIIGSIPAWAGETHCGGSAILPMPVYPRVGGGNILFWAYMARVVGLSPRGRGKREMTKGSDEYSGSIPAWAGETRRASAARHCRKVYPRVGGGNLIVTPKGLPVAGLSPRGRGKLDRVLDVVADTRSIPAWAGETRR